MSSSQNSSNPSPPSGGGGGDGGGSDAASSVAIASIVVGGIVIIVVVSRLIKCFVKVRTRESNSAEQQDRRSPSSWNLETGPTGTTTKTGSIILDTSMEKFLENILKEKPVRLTPELLKDFTFNYAVKLGEGGFGVAYKGQFPNGVPIAVKVLHKTLDRRAEEQFMAEVATAGRTYHIHLVRLYGFCFDPTVKALVYEFVENGSLDRYLFSQHLRLEWGKLYEIAVGTAKGVRYLHEECEQRIVHYDIKPGNVLLDGSFSPKVADFGLAKLCSRDATHVSNTGARGTPGYAAPEMWMPLPLTHKCDVYSFGMLLFEILGRRRNLDFGRSESQEWLPKWVWEKFESGGIQSLAVVYGIEENEKEKAERLCKVALWCVQYKPESRPSMSMVVRMLEGGDHIPMPQNPFQHLAFYETDLPISSASLTASTSRLLRNGRSFSS